MDPDDMRGRVAAARVARLATIRPQGGPHLVPITFALDGERLVTAVDHKPKSTTDLQRLANIRAEPRVSVLVDHYDDDWRSLWWVRLDGNATVSDTDAARSEAAALLAPRYPAYVDRPPAGPVIVVAIAGWTGWSAS